MIIDNGLIRIRFKNVNLRDTSEVMHNWIPSVYFFTNGHWQYCCDLLAFWEGYGQAVDIKIIENSKKVIRFQITWIEFGRTPVDIKEIYEYELRKGIPILWITIKEQQYQRDASSIIHGFHTEGLQPFDGKGRFTYHYYENVNGYDFLHDDRVDNASYNTRPHNRGINFITNFDPSYDFMMTAIVVNPSVEGIGQRGTSYPRLYSHTTEGLLIQDHRDLIGRDGRFAIGFSQWDRTKFFAEAEREEIDRILYTGGAAAVDSGHANSSEITIGGVTRDACELATNVDSVTFIVEMLPKGSYIAYARVAKDQANDVDIDYGVWNLADGAFTAAGAMFFIAAYAVTTGGVAPDGNWEYLVMPFVVNESDLNDAIAITVQNKDAGDDDLLVDYFLIVPLSNGFDKPQDLSKVAMIK